MMIRLPSTTKKIAIVGAHRTGKTSLARRISNSLDLPYIPEVARELMTAAGDCYDWRESPAVGFFQHSILSMHLFHVMVRQETGFVSDRSVIDIMAYIDWRLEVSNHSLIDYTWLVKTRSAVEDILIRDYPKNLFAMYDVILFFPCHDKMLEKDDVQSVIDANIQRYMESRKMITITPEDTLNIGGKMIKTWEDGLNL